LNAIELAALNVTIVDLMGLNKTAEELLGRGFTPDQLFHAGFALDALRDAGAAEEALAGLATTPPKEASNVGTIVTVLLVAVAIVVGFAVWMRRNKQNPPPPLTTQQGLGEHIITDEFELYDPVYTLNPLQGLDDEPLVTLQEAAAAAEVHCGGQIQAAVKLALEYAAERARLSTLGTLAELDVAVLHLYTQPTKLYSWMNGALGGHGKDGRDALPHYFPFIKLFHIALFKLPPGERMIVYRAVRLPHRLIIGASPGVGDTITFWGETSTTESPDALQDVNFLGHGAAGALDVGERTVFQIMSVGGRDVSGCSMFREEKEWILPSGAKFVIDSIRTGLPYNVTEIKMHQLAVDNVENVDGMNHPMYADPTRIDAPAAAMYDAMHYLLPQDLAAAAANNNIGAEIVYAVYGGCNGAGTDAGDPYAVTNSGADAGDPYAVTSSGADAGDLYAVASSGADAGDPSAVTNSGGTVAGDSLVCAGSNPAVAETNLDGEFPPTTATTSHAIERCSQGTGASVGAVKSISYENWHPDQGCTGAPTRGDASASAMSFSTLIRNGCPGQGDAQLLKHTLEQSSPDLYDVLADPIVVEPNAKLLGRGNYGAVFLGRVGEVPAAIKTLNPKGKQSQREVDDLNHEIAMMHMLHECGRHPHLMRLLQAESGTHPKLALELAVQGDLKHYMNSLTHLDSVTWGACAVYFAAQIAQGMALLEKCKSVAVCSVYISFMRSLCFGEDERHRSTHLEVG
jgi:hypothetical protein